MHHAHAQTTHIGSSGSLTEGFAAEDVGTSFSPLSPPLLPSSSFTLSFGTLSPSTFTTAAFCVSVTVCGVEVVGGAPVTSEGVLFDCCCPCDSGEGVLMVMGALGEMTGLGAR